MSVKLKTLRETQILSAGMYVGMRNVYMAEAANTSLSRTVRTMKVKAARESHHTYLARMREANGATGYRAPELTVAGPMERETVITARVRQVAA